MSSRITVDRSKCISCGTCTEECHRHLPVDRRADMDADGVECIGCLHCYAVCPQGAIQVDGMTAAADERSRVLDESRLLSFLAFRRSVRRFTARHVPRDIVDKLITAACYIPSGGNSHAYRFTAITRGERRERLEEELRRIYTLRKKIFHSTLLRNAFALLSNRQTRAFLRDDIYLGRISFLLDQYARGEDPVFYHAPLVIVVHSDTLIPTPDEDGVLAAYNIVLMAQALGLSSCFVSLAQNAINTSRTCRRILDMNPADRIHAVVALGYPALQFHRAVPKEPKAAAWPGAA
jgi:nitroreductase/NAD-dependent dihydropyrimidine dehydrogenase PreA subunit